ncbi:hypothetical protein IC617_08420 [Neiella sp. HB171785]|uniref:Uncharacterized protein n=1 Tax=Neiella litorisoli TaxID=2771431 RepID=A0A8J6QRN3_9GAMM|nr:hypothetical protein [Neiella litorisoli]MBD1389449.1 hypothetical protein [Neiella litorisoli]
MTGILTTEDFTINSDSQVTDGCDVFCGNYQKIHRIGHLIIAGTGRRVTKFAFLHALKQALAKRAEATDIFTLLSGVVVSLDLGKWVALVLDMDSKTLYHVSNEGIAPVIPPIAIGSGGTELINAYRALSAVEKRDGIEIADKVAVAFEVASAADVLTGGEVQSVSLEQALALQEVSF